MTIKQDVSTTVESLAINTGTCNIPTTTADVKAAKPDKADKSVAPRLLTIATWCRVMGFGRSKTYEMLKNGQLKAVKIAGRTLLPMSEADRLISEAQ